MKPIVNLIAVILQLVCLIVAASRYDMGAGYLVLGAILCNSIQAATTPKE